MTHLPESTIRRTIEQKAECHPELRHGLSLVGVRRILAREGVALFRASLPRPAQLLFFAGVWSIVVDCRLAERLQLRYALHELGHFWLHAEPTGPFETCFHVDDWWEPDPKEDDAELFAMLVLSGE